MASSSQLHETSARLRKIWCPEADLNHRHADFQQGLYGECSGSDERKLFQQGAERIEEALPFRLSVGSLGAINQLWRFRSDGASIPTRFILGRRASRSQAPATGLPMIGVTTVPPHLSTVSRLLPDFALRNHGSRAERGRFHRRACMTRYLCFAAGPEATESLKTIRRLLSGLSYRAAKHRLRP